MDGLDPVEHVLFCSAAHVDARINSAHDGRVRGQPYRETASREPDDGALAGWRIRALQWQSGLIAISVEARVLTS
jgi:hypothetical protein